MMTKFLLAKKYFSEGAPLAMIYFVTKTCNCTCAHCFYWESLNKPRPKELTVPEVKKIAQKLGPLLYLRISGGEPFIRRDFFEIIQTFSEECRPSYIGIPSNGFYTDRMVQFARRCAALSPRMDMGISIDDMGEHHDRIRGPKNLFNIAMETFKQLKAVKSEVPNLTIGFITTAMKSNSERLVPLFDFLSNLGPDGIACNYIRDDTKVAEEKNVDLKQFEAFSKRCDEYNAKKSDERNTFFDRMRNEKTDYGHEIRKKTILENKFQIPCVAGDKIVVMYSEGEVHPCETLGYEIGNIRDYDYDMQRILASERGRAIREKIVKEYCFCTHECFTSASISLSKKQMFKLGMRALVHG